MLDREDVMQIERLKNIAANGRLFNSLMFVLILFIASRIDEALHWIGLFPILSIGCAYVADTLDQRRPSLVFAVGSVIAAVTPILILPFLS